MKRRAGTKRTPCSRFAQRRAARIASCLLVLLVLAAPIAATAAAGELRFAVDSEPVWAIDDTTRIPEPSEIGWNLNRWLVDEHWLWPLDDLLALRAARPAGDINALDEVPACSWFQPRNGKRAMSLRDVARGNAPAAGIARGPLPVLAGRCSSEEPYLLVRDSRGDRWMLEFDDPDRPGLATAAAVISARLLHAAGYNVLPCRIATIDPSDLTLSEAAREFDLRGGEGELQAEELDRLMLHLAANPRLRVAASRLPAGVIKGGFRGHGRRADDPNDGIPHEDRRVLRGLLPLAAWLDHPGFRPGRTLDLYLESGGFLRHYLVGLAATLSCLEFSENDGAETSTPATEFDARHWRPRDPFLPSAHIGHADLYWGLALMLSFDETQIRAVVSAAELPAEQETVVVAQLLARRQAIAYGYLEHVNGARAFRLRDEGHGRWSLLCEDVGVAAGLRAPAEIIFLMTYAYGDGRDSGAQQVRGSDQPAFDLTPFAPAPTSGADNPRRYGMATLQARSPQGGGPEGRTCVHIHFPPDGPPRIVGIQRD